MSSPAPDTLPMPSDDASQPAPPAAVPQDGLIARVAVPSPLRRTFDYRLPASLIALHGVPQPGCRLRVPFGRRELTGVLLDVCQHTDVSGERLRDVLDILDSTPLIPSHLLDLWLWAARYYHHPVGEVLHTLLPVGLRNKGAATIKRRRTDADLTMVGAPDSDRSLTAEQQHACEAIAAQLGQFACFLLDGVTGSGKTEVYLQAIQQCLDRNLQALVLVPEIGLTPQTISRFAQRFSARLAVLHSGLTHRQRLNAWLEAGSGAADIVIGTRSAVFTPLARPGLMIIDEEHDGSFKQQDGFRYSARDLAVIRAQREGVPVVLGSATPSLESLHNALSGRYQHLRLTQRAGSAAMPQVRLLDTNNQPLQDGLSPPLLDAIGEHLARGQQALIFINRRGFAPVLQCPDCGWVAECDHCDARLTLHHRPAHLCCHHCERRQPVTRHCPNCQGKATSAVGAGTERIEMALGVHFPDTRIIRIDRDATSRKDELDRLLTEVQQAGPCILVGTQMIAKGHHFPRVTLAGVLDADSGLFSADFRGQEFMAQLLVQVAGRAGRADMPGEVLIQTRNATHLSLQTLIHQGYHALAEHLLEERRQSGMPPFGHLALIRAEALSASAPADFLSQARQLLDDYLVQQRWSDPPQVSGPLPAPMEKRANRFRQQLLLRSARRTTLQATLAWLTQQLEQHSDQRKVRWSVDVDPQDMI